MEPQTYVPWWLTLTLGVLVLVVAIPLSIVRLVYEVVRDGLRAARGEL